jgi:L-alanine-DL-glutamate epimerase-like enolase superfamily enzyme
VHALGKRVGGKMDLMIDPFCYYKTFSDALKVGYACDEEGFFWLEDPYMDGGTSHFGHQRLKEFIKTPLLQAEKVRGLEEHVNFMLAKATDYVRGDPTWDGITATMKIAHAAEGLGVDIELHGSGPAQRHVMSALRNSNYYEMVWVHPSVDCMAAPQRLYKSGFYDGLDAIGKDGCVPLPEGLGLGVEYDWDAIKRMTVGSKVFQ